MTRRQVVHLAESQLDEAAQALALAFQDDPLQSYTFPDPDERRRLSPPHFATLLRYGLLSGQVLSGVEPVSGAVVWIPPGATPTPEHAEASGLTRLSETIGADATDRFSRVIDYGERLHQRDMPEPHWYVMVVGVAPAFQGQGYGRALLQPMLDRADSDGVPCYLETTQPKNVTFYQRLGFRVVVDDVEPASGLRFWTFRRDSVRGGR
jgi:ribosomal protein S18 acetylase RimI-like enzyme